ncbi:MAG TPA: cell wall hydrolase [Burkholderiales bacterium]|nr:cell wall hydrolase [Burkholderiales bacterium]
MLWKLRLLWYRADKGALAFGLFFSLVVGALVFAMNLVFGHRDAEHARVRDFHARSLECLARNVYYEARGESSAGQYAVAEVTMNRRASPRYPKTVCEVVYQKNWDPLRKRHVGAFSWTEFDVLDEPTGVAWQRAVHVAEDVYYQRRPAALRGVLHFHATYVQPEWSKERQVVARIGRHVFYR